MSYATDTSIKLYNRVKNQKSKLTNKCQTNIEDLSLVSQDLV